MLKHILEVDIITTKTSILLRHVHLGNLQTLFHKSGLTVVIIYFN